jgi:hypothetical protein
LTIEAVHDLMTKHKMPYDQAWEMMREEWAFLPTEEDVPELGVDPDRLIEVLDEDSEPSLANIEANPLMLEVANLDGSLKPEFQEWESVLPLDADSLVPMWWPGEIEGQILSAEERAGDFAGNLEVLVAMREGHSAAHSPARNESSKPQHVLYSLLWLRSLVVEEWTPPWD